MPRVDPDRRRLRLLAGLMILLALASLGVLAWREVEVRREVYASITADRGAATVRELESLFGPLQAQLGTLLEWGAAGELDPSDPGRLDARLGPILRSQPAVASVALAGSDGSGYRIDLGDDGAVRRLDPADGVDLRRSEWYEAAEDDPAGTFHWSATGRDDDPVALWASSAWTADAPGTVRRVAAVGAATATVDSVRGRLGVTPRGMLALLGADESISWYVPGHGPRFVATDTRALLEPQEGPERLLAEALYAGNRASGDPGRSYRFDHDGGGWWAWRGALGTAGGQGQLLLVLPESDLTSRLQTVTSPLTYGLLALFGLSVFLLLRFTLGLRRRLLRISDAASHTRADPDQLRALIDGGESERLEFKSTLRWNLRENRPGREIEQSWLKTVVAFLNTDGGTLLVGVADDGKVVGTGPDGFPNDDKYLLHVNNLVQRYVGVEFARYLRFDLRPVDGESVLVMDVDAADEPAFLRTNDDDLFYVRMGPASRRLSLRRTLEYLRERQRG